MPDPVQQVVRAAYGDATSTIFLIAAAVSVIAVIAVSFLPNRPLRTTIDISADEDPMREGGTSLRDLVDA